MASQDLRINLAERIANRWNDTNISYAVVHGLGDYPKQIGRDLDLVIDKNHTLKAIDIAIKEGRAHGFKDHLVRWSMWGLYQLVLINKENCISLPLDFMCTVGLWQAKFINFMTEQKLIRITNGDGSVGPFKVSREGVFIKSCLRPLVCGDLKRFGDSKVLNDKEEFPLPVELPESLSKKEVLDLIGTYGVNLLELDDKSVLQSQFPKALYKLQFSWLLKHPADTISNIFKAFKKHILLWLFNSSLIYFVKSNKAHDLQKLVESDYEYYKKYFIEVRSFNCTSGLVKLLCGFFYTWRFKPVSEFNISIVFDHASNHVEQNSIVIKRGRWFFNPDYELKLDASLSTHEQLSYINKVVFDLLVDKYAFSNLKNKIS